MRRDLDPDLDPDLMDTLADDSPAAGVAFSAWLGGRDLEQLAAVARAARSAGESFGGRLRDEDRTRSLDA